MGQQQVLILILVVIIVGLAVALGIQLFKYESLVLEEARMEQQLLEIASEAQAYYRKEKMMGGGGKSFKDLTWNDIPCPLDEVITDLKKCVTTSGNESYILLPKVNELGIVSTIHTASEHYLAVFSIHPDSTAWNKKW